MEKIYQFLLGLGLITGVGSLGGELTHEFSLEPCFEKSKLSYNITTPLNGDFTYAWDTNGNGVYDQNRAFYVANQVPCTDTFTREASGLGAAFKWKILHGKSFISLGQNLIFHNTKNQIDTGLSLPVFSNSAVENEAFRDFSSRSRIKGRGGMEAITSIILGHKYQFFNSIYLTLHGGLQYTKIDQGRDKRFKSGFSYLMPKFGIEMEFSKGLWNLSAGADLMFVAFFKGLVKQSRAGNMYNMANLDALERIDIHSNASFRKKKGLQTGLQGFLNIAYQFHKNWRVSLSGGYTYIPTRSLVDYTLYGTHTTKDSFEGNDGALFNYRYNNSQVSSKFKYKSYSIGLGLHYTF
jgi:hypothetical protein